MVPQTFSPIKFPFKKVSSSREKASSTVATKNEISRNKHQETCGIYITKTENSFEGFKRCKQMKNKTMFLERKPQPQKDVNSQYVIYEIKIIT